MDIPNAQSDQKITIKPLKNKAKGLQEFLKKHAYDKSKHPIITNTRIADSENGIFGAGRPPNK